MLFLRDHSTQLVDLLSFYHLKGTIFFTAKLAQDLLLFAELLKIVAYVPRYDIKKKT